MDKVAKDRWVDELERADELAEPLGVQTVSVLPQISDDELREMQAEDTDLGPVMDWIENGQPPTADVVRQHSLDTRNLWGQVPTCLLYTSPSPRD